MMANDVSGPTLTGFVTDCDFSPHVHEAVLSYIRKESLSQSSFSRIRMLKYIKSKNTVLLQCVMMSVSCVCCPPGGGGPSWAAWL